MSQNKMLAYVPLLFFVLLAFISAAFGGVDDPERGIAWLNGLLDFVSKPGAWGILILALSILGTWKFGDRIGTGIAAYFKARLDIQKTAEADAHARLREAEARAKIAEAEADEIRTREFRDMADRLAGALVRVSKLEEKEEDTARRERECVANMHSLKGEFVAVKEQNARQQKEIDSLRLENSDQAAALLVVRLQMEERHIEQSKRQQTTT